MTRFVRAVADFVLTGLLLAAALAAQLVGSLIGRRRARQQTGRCEVLDDPPPRRLV